MRRGTWRESGNVNTNPGTGRDEARSIARRRRLSFSPLFRNMLESVNLFRDDMITNGYLTIGPEGYTSALALIASAKAPRA